MNELQYPPQWRNIIEILRSRIGHKITDVQIPEFKTKKREQSSDFIQVAYRLLDEQGGNIGIWSWEIENTDDIIALFVDPDFILERWPGGPERPWVSIRPHLPEGEMLVVSIDLLSGRYEDDVMPQGYKEVQPLEAIVFNLEDGQSIAFAIVDWPPTLVELIYNQDKIRDIYASHKYRFPL